MQNDQEKIDNQWFDLPGNSVIKESAMQSS